MTMPMNQDMNPPDDSLIRTFNVLHLPNTNYRNLANVCLAHCDCDAQETVECLIDIHANFDAEIHNLCLANCQCPSVSPLPPPPPPPPPPGASSVTITSPRPPTLGTPFCSSDSLWCAVIGNPDGTYSGTITITRSRSAAGYIANGYVTENVDFSTPLQPAFSMSKQALHASVAATGEINSFSVYAHDEL